MARVLPQKDELVPPRILHPYSFYTRSLFCLYASFMVLGWKHGLKVETKNPLVDKILNLSVGNTFDSEWRVRVNLSALRNVIKLLDSLIISRYYLQSIFCWTRCGKKCKANKQKFRNSVENDRTPLSLFFLLGVTARRQSLMTCEM